MMRNTFVCYRRVFHVLITSILTILLVCNGVLPFLLYRTEAAQSRDNSSSTGPNIPFGQDLTNYNPSTDGYYAYLPVRYEIPHENTEIMNQDQETTSSYIPILCYQNTIYIETGILEEITELFCDIDEDNIRITWLFNTRRLNMAVGSASSTYEEGFLSTLQEPMVKMEISSIGAPIRMEDDIYIPMDPVFRMFGMSPTVFESFYWFKQPQVNAVDVLARLYDSADKDAEFSGKQYFILPSDSASSAFGATIADNFYGLATFDPDSWKTAFANFFDDEAINKMYYKQIAQDLLSMDSDTSEQLNKMAMNGLDISLSATAQAIGADADSVDIPGLISALESAPRFMPENEFSKLLTQLKKAQYIQSGINKLNKYDLVGIGTDGLIAMINNLNIYIDADRIANDGLDTILSTAYANEIALTDGERSVLSKEHENYPKKRWISGIVAYQESCDDMAISMAQAFLDTFYTGGVLSPTSLGLKIANFVADGVGLRTVDDAEEYMKAFFAPFLIYRFGKGLYFSQKTRSVASLSDKYLREQISLAYLYLRTCRLEDEYIIGSGNFDETSVSTCKGHINVLDKLLAVLARDYVEDGDLLPDTAYDRRVTLSDSKRIGTLSNLTIPLYFDVYGNVLEKNDDETPVTDAECRISYDGEEIGYFSEDNKYGSFSVHIPMKNPKSVRSNIDDLDNVKISMKFSSPTVEGEANKDVPFQTQTVYNLDKVFLDDFDWYQFIRDELAPVYGYTNTDDQTATITNDNWDSVFEWNDRNGIVSAEIIDMTGDGKEDLLLYRFEKTSGYALIVDIYTYTDGTVSKLNEIELISGVNGRIYESIRAGIIHVDGNPYIWVETYSNAYYANGSGFYVCFYGWDGSNFRVTWMNGKTHGGSSGIVYSLLTYSDEEYYTEEIFYEQDGSYFSQHPEDKGKMVEIASDYQEAVKMGYHHLGLPETVDSLFFYSSGTSNKDSDAVFPTYWDTDVLKKTVELNISGPVYETNLITDSVRDYTSLQDILSGSNDME